MSDEWADLEEHLSKLVTRATDVRQSVRADWRVTDGPEELHLALLDHRSAQDSLEELVANVARSRSRLDQALRQATDVLEDAEAGADHLKEEYTTAKEKNAHLSVQTVEQRVLVRQARRRRDMVAEAHEYVKTLYWGLDGSRRDLDTRIRLISLRTSLER